MHYYKNKNAQSAFTILELMIVVAIAGVLAAVALPSYRTMVQNNCLTTKTNSLVSYLQYARSEAVKLQQSVTITQKSGSWTNGWVITSPSATLKDVNSTSCNNTSVTGSATSFSYNAKGFIDNSGDFKICDDRTGETGRQILINTVGRPNTNSKYNGCS